MKPSQLKFLRFLIAGVIGFITDAIVFFGIVFGLSGTFVLARIVASLVAMLATWTLNRNSAFAEGSMTDKPIELGKYLLASLTGMTANLALLSLVAPHDGQLYHIPSYVLGAAAGLLTNYVLYDRMVFNAKKKVGAA